MLTKDAFSSAAPLAWEYEMAKLYQWLGKDILNQSSEMDPIKMHEWWEEE